MADFCGGALPSFLTRSSRRYLAQDKPFTECCTRNVQELLDASKSCQRIVDTPLPFTYTLILGVLLFIFVYSTPFIYWSHQKKMNTRRWYSSSGLLPSLMMAFFYYGVMQIAIDVENPFNFADVDRPSGFALSFERTNAARTSVVVSPSRVAPAGRSRPRRVLQAPTRRDARHRAVRRAGRRRVPGLLGDGAHREHPTNEPEAQGRGLLPHLLGERHHVWGHGGITGLW